jgi:LEA14-like dessication related protein
MLKKVLILLGLVGIGVYLTNKITLAKNLDFTINNIAFKLGLPISELFITLNIINKTAETGSINSIDGNVYFNKELIGKISQQNELKIMSNSITKISFTVRLNSSKSVESLVNAIAKKEATINFNGSLKIDGVFLPLNIDYKIL